MNALFERSWRRAWSALIGPGPGAGTGDPDGIALRDALLACYAEPQRRYHTQQHLEECLALLEQVRDLAEHPEEVEMALWFHDAIYDVKGSGNEELADRLLISALIEARSCERFEVLARASAEGDRELSRFFRRLGWKRVLGQRLRSLLGHATAGDVTMPQAYGGAPLTLHHFTRREVIGLLETAGFAVKEVLAVGDDGTPATGSRAYGWLVMAERAS